MQPALGVLLFSDYTIEELVVLAQLSEGLGYRFFWYTDVRFARECYVGLTAVALNTRTIKLGPGVTDPYSRHPAITAGTIATLDEVSGGRALLGLGTGGTGFRELGIEAKLPVAAMRETVEMVRALLRGGDVTAQGKVIALNGGRLLFDPVRREIPIYFATHGAQITVLAGRIADGVMIANTLDPKAFDFYARKLAEGMAKDGRPEGSVDLALRVEACISDNDDAAFEVMRRRVTARVLSQYPHWGYLTELGIELPRELIEIAERKDVKAAGRAAQWMPRGVVESMVLGGNAERCATQLARALDPRIASVMVRPHAIAGDNVASVLKAFAEDVFPRAVALRAALPTPQSAQVATGPTAGD
jgi:5,10-methylenetetrahydromethanopterin reductase